MYDSGSDSDSEYSLDQRPNIYAEDNQGPANLTAASFRQPINFYDENDELFQLGKAFSQFYRTNLLRKNNNIQCQFEKDMEIFSQHKKNMTVIYPKPDLYFLPITILFIDKKVDLLTLRNQIIQKYSQVANVILKQIPKRKQEDQIQVMFHTPDYKAYYRIRNILYQLPLPQRHLKPQCLDKDICLNPFFDFYSSKKYQKLEFQETCGCVLYWAYRKGLLNNQYFHENVLKMLVLYFYFSQGQGLINIIEAYQNKYRNQLNKIEKMYKVKKNLQCQLDKQLFQNANFLLKTRKTFYIDSHKKYSIMKQILPIPYPVTEKQIQQFLSKKSKEKLDKRVNPCLKFIKMMQFMANSVHRSQKIILDYTKNRLGKRQASMDFNIEIIHPVLKTNMCESITDDNSKIRKIKHQINIINKVLKQSKTKLQLFKFIFQQN